MKKILIAFAAFAALVACQKVETVTPTPATRYSFNIDVNGANSFSGVATKAVKTGWEAGDKVFVFFKEGQALLSDVYAEMTYDGAAWAAVQRGDGSLGESGQLIAVYVPFADDSVKPEYADGKWNIAGGDVYFTHASNVPYTVSANTVTATINMALAEGYVQFYITGVAAGETLTCDKIDSYDTISVGDDMTVTSAKKGAGMTGRAYKEGTVFYGKYNGGDKALTILTLTKEGKVYKMMKAKTLEANQAYSLGAFAEDAASWTVAPDMLPGLFTVAPGKQVRFSKGNLYYDGASSSFKFEEKQKDYVMGESGKDPNHVSYFNWSAHADAAIAAAYSDASASADDKFFANETSKLAVNQEMWFNPTTEEWAYMATSREGLEHFNAMADGELGLFLLPDGLVWKESWGEKPENSAKPTDITASWPEMEAAGVVMLPAAGFVFNFYNMMFMPLSAGETATIWTGSSANAADGAYCMSMSINDNKYAFVKSAEDYRGNALPVRLVVDPQYNPMM